MQCKRHLIMIPPLSLSKSATLSLTKFSISSFSRQCPILSWITALANCPQMSSSTGTTDDDRTEG